MVAIGAVTAVLVSGCYHHPVTADPWPLEEMDRIAFVYWFATVICIAIFALGHGGDRLLGADVPRPAR